MIAEDRYSTTSATSLNFHQPSSSSRASSSVSFFSIRYHRDLFHRLVSVIRSNEFLPLTLSLLALVFSRTVDQTLYYRLNFSYSYFIWYLSTIMLPVAFLIIFWPVVLYKLWFTNDITKEMKAFPYYKFAVMGLFDTAFSLFSTFPIQHLGGDLSNVLSQSVLPINMMFAAYFLGTKFKKNHYLGAALVIYGIAIKLSASSDFSGTLGWIFVMVLAQTPAAASNVYKQIGMKDADLDVWYANAWIGTFQLLFGIMTFWTMYIGAFMDPYPALTDTTSFSDYMSNANKCLLGQKIEIDGISKIDCNDSDDVDGTWKEGSSTCQIDCSAQDMWPLWLFFIFILFNVIYNQFMLIIFKMGSSVLFVVASAVRLPLVAALNSWEWIAGPAQEAYHKEDTFALIILVIAIVVYYSEPEETPVEDEEDEESLMGKKLGSSGSEYDGSRRTRYEDEEEEEEGDVFTSGLLENDYEQARFEQGEGGSRSKKHHHHKQHDNRSSFDRLSQDQEQQILRQERLSDASLDPAFRIPSLGSSLYSTNSSVSHDAGPNMEDSILDDVYIAIHEDED